MGLEFIARTLRTFGIVLLIFLPFGFYYLGPWPTLAVLSGGVWGALNLIFLTGLIRSTIRPEGAETRQAALFILVKFPLLFVAGYFLLKVRQFEPLHLLIGFSGVLVIMILKVLGRLVLGLDTSKKQLPGAAL